ncbi:hypothetical protein M3Y97_00747600 [Aphelenchoides bicaudatus]|nr:hypothetical protein M3Y97_00747600 [Aphelenchoides bicaudatus]
MHAHEAMAQLFVNHVVDENPNKTLRLQQKLLRTDEREAKKRQDQDELGRKKALLEGLWELYEYNVPKEQIRKLLNIHKYDQDKVMDQIFEEFFADDLQKKSQPKNQVVKTVYSPRMPMIFDRTRSPTSKMSRLEETEAEALYFANKYAEDLKQRAKHHQESAFKHGPKDARFGALTAIARDENKRAEYFEDKQFEYKASNLSANDSIDLHNMKVAPALRYVKICIDTVKKRRPTQKTLEIITGRGANNPNGKPVMKLAVQQFLANMKMSYQPQNENPGTVFVKLL